MITGLKAFIAAAVIFGSLFFIWSPAARADGHFAVARSPDGTYVMKLYKAACDRPDLIALVPPQYHGTLHKAEATYTGAIHAACWTVLPNGIGIVDDEKDAFVIPGAAFKDPNKPAPLPRGQIGV